MTMPPSRWPLLSPCVLQISLLCLAACQRTLAPPDHLPERARGPATGTLAAGPWNLTWTTARGEATRPGHSPVLLYDHHAGKQGCIESVAELLRQEPEWATEAAAYYVGTERVVAVVGSFVTTVIDYNGYCGGAHPFHRRSFDTVDLATGGKPVTLEGLFGNAARAACAGHRGLSRALGEDAAVIDAPWTTAHFAVKAIEGASVIVRLGLPHATEADAGTLGLFDIRLPIPAHLRSTLLQADKAGTLLGSLAPELAGRRQGVYRDDELVQ